MSKKEDKKNSDKVKIIYPQSKKSKNKSYYDYSWWGEDDYDYSSGYSASSYWSSRWSGSSWSSYSVHGDGYKYQKILQEIFRSANVVRIIDPETGVEKKIEVKWSDGVTRNRIDSKEILLSPDVANTEYCKQASWTEDQLIDVLIGQALTEASIKVESSQDAQDMIDSITKEKHHKLAETLWYATETLNARESVLKEYPGFAAYFAANLKYHMDKEAKQNIEKELKAELNAENVLTSILWNMLHPSEKLDLPKEYKDIVNEAITNLQNVEDAKERAALATSIVEQLLTVSGEEDTDRSASDHSDSDNHYCSYAECECPEYKTYGECLCNCETCSESRKKKSSPNQGFKPGTNPGLDRQQFSEKVDNQTNPELSALEDNPEEGNPSDITHSSFNMNEQTIVTKIPTCSSLKTSYKKQVRVLQPKIQALRSRLKLKNEIAKLYEHGLKRGHIDEGSIYKLGFAKIGHQDDQIFERQEVHEGKKIAIGLLIDESGSMSGYRAETARDLAITLYNALADLNGVELVVAGHTGELESRYLPNGSTEIIGYDKMWMRHFVTPEYPGYPETLMNIQGIAQNLDGFAIEHLGKDLLRWFPDADTAKMLIHISDGLPGANHYGGAPAMDHMFRVSSFLRGKGCKVYGIGVDYAFTPAAGLRMYGANNWALIDNSLSIQVVSNLITKAIKESCKM